MIAVISDIHGNLPAFEAVLADMDAVGVERLWCLGDTLGYGPFVNECMQLVHARAEILLAGNHDLGVRGDVDAAMFGGTAGAGLAFARATIDDATRGILDRLEPYRQMEGVELYHGSARDPVWEYVRDAASATAHLAAQHEPLSIVGHAHAQVMFELPDGADHAMGGQVQEGTIIPLSTGVRRVFNPGSVGQPRDRDPRAACALLEENRVTFRRVPYDIARMRQAVLDAGLPAEVGERLELGW
jgi:predicted phosphodiesterase